MTYGRITHALEMLDLFKADQKAGRTLDWGYIAVAERTLREEIECARPEARDTEDAKRWREHEKVMHAATMPDALHIRLTMNDGGKVWGSQYVLDTAKFGRDTVLGIRAVGLSAEAQATKLFEAMRASPPQNEGKA